MKCGQQHVENVAKVAIDACCIVASTRAHGGPKNGKQHNDSEANPGVGEVLETSVSSVFMFHARNSSDMFRCW